MESNYHNAHDRGGKTHILDNNVDNGWGGQSLCRAFTGHDLMTLLEKTDCECKECHDEWIRRHGKDWSDYSI